MSKKGMLFTAIGATMIGIVVFSFTFAYFLYHNELNNPFLSRTKYANKKDLWISKIMNGLGYFEIIKKVSKKHFKKETFIIQSEYPLNNYLKQFRKHFKKSHIRFHHKLKNSRSFAVLSIYFEEKSNFLRVIEIKKRKKEQFYKIKEKRKKKKLIKTTPVKPSIISIVIDDVGGSKKLEKDFLNYPYPLTFAVIPFKIYSQSFSEKAKRHGKEVIIHAPMEGVDEKRNDPDNHYHLSSEKSNEDMSRLIDAYLSEVPYAVGLNNHKGSIATADPELMKRFFSYFRQKHLFFLDSRTSRESVAYRVAYDYGVPSLKRDIFLDNKDDINYISSQIYKLIRLGRKKNGAIGIGHFTKPNTLKVLKKFIPYFKTKKVKLVFLSQLIKRKKTYVSLRH